MIATDTVTRTVTVEGQAVGAYWWPIGHEFRMDVRYSAATSEHETLRSVIESALADADANSSQACMLTADTRIIVEEHRAHTPLPGGGYRGGLVAIRAYDATEFPSIADYVCADWSAYDMGDDE